MREKPPCKHTPETPVPLLCADCREKRRRVRDRLNRRDARARARGQKPRPVGTTVLPTVSVIDLADTLEAIHETVEALTASGRKLTLEEEQLVYAANHLQRILGPLLTAANDELVEIARNTTEYPTEYTPRRAKAIGPQRWKTPKPGNSEADQ